MVCFFNDTATTEIYTLSLHDALPISQAPPIRGEAGHAPAAPMGHPEAGLGVDRHPVRMALPLREADELPLPGRPAVVHIEGVDDAHRAVGAVHDEIGRAHV